jgi:Fur family ferric uptake transcriptional regulator
MVINIIAHADHHMTAEEIYRELGKQTQATNIATVYRTLDMLWEEGFASRNDLSEGKIVYCTYKHGPHIHLVCRCCTHVMDTNPKMLKPLGDELYAHYKFKADLQHITIFGVCSDCR